MMNKNLYWEYSPEWDAWWLMIPNGGLTASRGYGPFVKNFEIQMAADVHEVPFIERDAIKTQLDKSAGK